MVYAEIRIIKTPVNLMGQFTELGGPRVEDRRYKRFGSEIFFGNRFQSLVKTIGIEFNGEQEAYIFINIYFRISRRGMM